MMTITAQEIHPCPPWAHAFIVHDTPDELCAAVARRIAQVSAHAIGERGLFRIALAGGETPRHTYECLRSSLVDWRHVHVYFGDERCLPYGDVHRNDTMAREALLEHVAIPRDNVHVTLAERGARIAALEYAELLQHALPLDLVLLGVGEDGHTASLFPGNAATEQNESVVAVFDAPKPPPERVSLGMRALNGARSKIFMVSGAAKREALRRMLGGTALPASRVLGAEWHVDRAAVPDESAFAHH